MTRDAVHHSRTIRQLIFCEMWPRLSVRPHECLCLILRRMRPNASKRLQQPGIVGCTMTIALFPATIVCVCLSDYHCLCLHASLTSARMVRTLGFSSPLASFFAFGLSDSALLRW